MPALFSYDALGLDLHPWLETFISACIAIIVMGVVYHIALFALRRLTASHAMASSVLRYAERPLEFILPLLGLQTVWTNAPANLHMLELIRHLNSLALIGCMTWLGVECIRGGCDAVIAAHPINVSDNLEARRIHTTSRVVSRMLISAVALLGLASILMSFPNVRQVGMSLLASAGMAGLVAGIAARPVLGNLIAGLQIALTQPIRIDDVVIVQGEWGRIEEISSTYVVVHIWDERRMVVPLQWFVENPFQNWTRTGSNILGTVILWVDYRMPLEPLREEVARISKTAREWDGKLAMLQVTDTSEKSMQLRVLVSSSDSGRSWDLRCKLREGLIAFIRDHCPDYLPTVRISMGEHVAAQAQSEAANQKPQA